MDIVFTLPSLSEISEKLEHISKVIFDIQFLIQSYAENMKKFQRAIQDLLAN